MASPPVRIKVGTGRIQADADQRGELARRKLGPVDVRLSDCGGLRTAKPFWTYALVLTEGGIDTRV
jgi:hypothetical protein